MAEKEVDATPPAPHADEPQVFEGTPQAEGEAPKPEKLRRRRGRGFALFLAAVGLLGTALGVVTVVLKKHDERLAALADAVERAAQNPGNFILKEKEELAAWVAQKLPRHEEEPPAASAPATGEVELEAGGSYDGLRREPSAGRSGGPARSSGEASGAKGRNRAGAKGGGRAAAGSGAVGPAVQRRKRGDRAAAAPPRGPGRGCPRGE